MAFVNPSNIVKGVIIMLKDHMPMIDSVIRKYEPGKTLTIYEGIRRSVPVGAYPVLEIEPDTGDIKWAATRLQRNDYRLKVMVTTASSIEDKHAEYSAALSTAIIEILSNPSHLQFEIPNEQRTWFDDAVENTNSMDAMVENISYKTVQAGTFRVCTFSYRVSINEPYTADAFDKSLEPSNSLVVGGPNIVTPE